MTVYPTATADREDWLRQLADLVQAPVVVCVDGRVVWSNPAADRVLGEACAVGRAMADLVEMADVAGLADGAVVPARLKASGRETAASIRRTRGGAVVVQFDDGRSDHQVVDHLAYGVVVADSRGVVRSFNPAAERTFGYPARDIVGQKLSLLMPQPYADEHPGYVDAYLRTGHARVIGASRETSGRRRDGSVFPLEINIAELKRDGEHLFVGTLRDISERKRRDDELKRARAELEHRVEERTMALRRLSRQNVQILNSASDGIIGLDHDGHVTFFNPAAEVLTGWQAGDLVDRPAHTVLRYMSMPGQPPDLAMEPLAPGAALCVGFDSASSERVFWRRDGSVVPIEITSAPIEEGQAITGAVLVFRDITERKRAERKLRLVAMVFDNTVEAIMVLDRNRSITAVNAAFTDITGFSADEVVGRLPTFATSDRQAPQFYDVLWAAVEINGRWAGELWNRRKDGREYAERLGITAIRGDEGTHEQYVVIFADITQRKLDEERIRYQASYDALTGLPNRQLFLDRLNQAVANCDRAQQQVGLLFLDLDGFKLVNDTLGHDVGDQLLKIAARRLCSCVRAGDTVSRLGGDEFTIIMPNLGNVRNAPVVCQRIIETLELPFNLKGHDVFVSASIGIALFPDDAADTATLLQHADTAMYRAKDQGKANYQFYTSNLNQEANERMAIRNALSRALERDEFRLHYQPKVALADGRVTGVEALLRWSPPGLGPVPPAKFVPIMEESGLIGAVGEWAVDTACAQHRAWLDAGLPALRIAVNLSARQLRQPNLPRTIADILARHGLGPQSLEIEITESMIMKDTENALAVLCELSDSGIHLAMDDFGTGYSSLNYLRRFPLHTIKIDRSFIADIATDREALEIVRTIISMGHSLRRHVVAEGVETDEQRLLLASLECDEIQGYLISPAVPADQIPALLRSIAP